MLLLLPEAGHQAMTNPATENLLWHQVRFLQRHLGVVPADRPGPPAGATAAPS